jgi:hypothetical protein
MWLLCHVTGSTSKHFGLGRNDLGPIPRQQAEVLNYFLKSYGSILNILK